MPRAVAAIFALVILASMGVYGFEAALESAGEDVTVVNETWTPDAGNVTTLNDSDITGAYYDHNVTVYDENDTLMDQGSDYKWLVSNGSVKAVSGGDLDGDDNATITYGYQETTQQQRDLTAMLGRIPQAIGLVIPVFALVLLFKVVAG